MEIQKHGKYWGYIDTKKVAPPWGRMWLLRPLIGVQFSSCSHPYACFWYSVGGLLPFVFSANQRTKRQENSWVSQVAVEKISNTWNSSRQTQKLKKGVFIGDKETHMLQTHGGKERPLRKQKNPAFSWRLRFYISEQSPPHPSLGLVSWGNIGCLIGPQLLCDMSWSGL